MPAVPPLWSAQHQSPSGVERRAAHMSWDRVGQLLEEGAAAILPIGAGAKQHGLHLPMNTDQIQAEWLAMRVADAVDGLIWPTLNYGYYPAFAAYAGSVSLTEATFEQAVLDITDGLLLCCRSQVVILDTGLSTQAAVARALSRTAKPGRCHHVKVYDGPRFRETARRLARQPHGSHADEIETSLMLALAPALVDMARAEPSPPLTGGVVDGPLTPSDAASPNYSPSGSFGSPQLATLDKGRELLAAMEADVIAAARDAINR